MKISVIIVSYNVCPYLLQCLDSLWRAASRTEAEVEVFVVDNASQDDTLSSLRRHYAAQLRPDHPRTRLHLIANQRNLGFGRANNQALRQSTGDYILFLNPDTLLGEDCLRDCLNEAQSQAQLGAMGVKMLNANGSFAPESRRGLPTPWVAFCKMSGLARLFPRSARFGHYYMGALNPDTTADIEIVSGAFMLCSRAALDRCGGFDEAFFMYGEDVDLSYRFLQKGFRNRYLPTPILHYKGESSKKNSFRYVHVFYGAMLIFLRKHFPTAACLLSPVIYAVIYLQSLLTLLRNWAKAYTHYLSPRPQLRPLHFHFVGTASQAQNFQAKAELCGATLTHSPTIAYPPQTDLVIFNTAEHNYQDILAQLETSPHSARLGLYHPQHDTLITAGEVLH